MADAIKKELLLPAGMSAQIVRDARGKCWEIKGFRELENAVVFQDIDTYVVLDTKACCDECTDDFFEDINLNSGPLEIPDEPPSFSPEESSSSSSEFEQPEFYQYEADVSCDTDCCDTHTLEWGFTKESCEWRLQNLWTFDILEVCNQDCGDESLTEWTLCLDEPKIWASFGIDVPGLWSCGYCCEPSE